MAGVNFDNPILDGLNNGRTVAIYLSGPISYNPEAASAIFEREEARLIDYLPPSLIGKISVINPTKFPAPTRHPSWSDWMRLCITKLPLASAVLFLEGWPRSKGAIVEMEVANSLSIPCYLNLDHLIRDLVTFFQNEDLPAGGLIPTLLKSSNIKFTP